jgi:hypothetical protein
MQYDYNKILQELKSLKTPEEKRTFIQKTIKEIQSFSEMTFSKIAANRVDHLKQKISYLEDIFILRNIMIESYLAEKQ